MKLGAAAIFGVMAVTALGSSCATKKYVRNRVGERVTPLENRTGELEETARRNTQEISRLNRDIQEVRAMADRAQQQADRAASSAEQANTRVTGVEQSVSDIRANLDKYTLKKTVTVFFEAGKTELVPETTAALDELAGQIKDKTGFILEIQGFASSEGNPARNEVLSQERCEGVRRYLADQHNVPIFRMSIIGMGVSRPVADNSTLEGRKQNRRVEVRLLTSSLAQTPAP
jgi:outer membrane protein OmpA-like peptidoglycan-associated protein